jgi:hypothetical protein
MVITVVYLWPDHRYQKEKEQIEHTDVPVMVRVP